MKAEEHASLLRDIKSCGRGSDADIFDDKSSRRVSARKSALQLNRAARERCIRPPERGVFHVRVRIAEVEGSQSEFVKCLEEIGAKVEHRVLSHTRNPAEPDLLHELKSVSM